MTPAQLKGYAEVVRWVRKRFPTKCGYSFRTKPRIFDKVNGECDGLACFSNKGGPVTITVRRDLCPSEAVSTLIHEVAHVVDVDRHGYPVKQDCHSEWHRESWGVALAEIYREYHEWRDSLDAR